MTQIAFFSTDFSAEPIVDELESARQGKQVFVEGQQRMSFGGTFYYRGAMPGIELNQHGYDNHLSWRFQSAPDGHIRTLGMDGEWYDPDVFYQQRWMHKDGPEQMRRARATGQKIIGDLDDDFWKLDKTNIAYHTTDPKNNPEFNRDHYWKVLAECDAITVSTEALRKRVEPLGVPTYVLRNAIDIARWPQNDPGADGYISWIGGIQWRAHDLEILKVNGLPRFLEENGLPCYHGGDSQVEGVPKFWTKIGVDPMKVKCGIAPLCHIAEYPQLWAPVNVSLIPLEKVYFNQAKSWLKQLESCAAGVPYIVSAGFPEQQLLVDEGTAGRVARNDKPSQWQDHLYDLLDPDVRRKEGAVNRAVAERHDIRTCWKQWDDAYREIVAL